MTNYDLELLQITLLSSGAAGIQTRFSGAAFRLPVSPASLFSSLTSLPSYASASSTYSCLSRLAQVILLAQSLLPLLFPHQFLCNPSLSPFLKRRSPLTHLKRTAIPPSMEMTLQMALSLAVFNGKLSETNRIRAGLAQSQVLRP